MAKGKTVTFFTLLFLAVFPALMLMFAGPLASQAHLISDDTADLLFNLCLYATIGIGGLAVVAALFYHPSRAPFKKWETQGRVLKEGRPREAWSNPEEMAQAAAHVAAPAAVVVAKVEESVEDIAPPPAGLCAAQVAAMMTMRRMRVRRRLLPAAFRGPCPGRMWPRPPRRRENRTRSSCNVRNARRNSGRPARFWPRRPSARPAMCLSMMSRASTDRESPIRRKRFVFLGGGRGLAQR